MVCVLNASLKKYMSCFALETNRSLKITLKMRFGEFVCVWSGIFFYFFFLFSVAPIHLSCFGLFRLLKLSTWIRFLHYVLTKKRNKKVPKELY